MTRCKHCEFKAEQCAICKQCDDYNAVMSKNPLFKMMMEPIEECDE